MWTGPQREVDYRELCLAMLSKLERVASEPALPPISSHHDSDAKSRQVAKWLLQILSQVGPEPGRDAELYRTLHAALDQAGGFRGGRGHIDRDVVTEPHSDDSENSNDIKQNHRFPSTQ